MAVASYEVTSDGHACATATANGWEANVVEWAAAWHPAQVQIVAAFAGNPLASNMALIAIMVVFAALALVLMFIRTSPRRGAQRSVLASDGVMTPGALRGYALAMIDAQRLPEAEEVAQIHLSRLPGDARFHALSAALASIRGDHAAAAAGFERAAGLLRREEQPGQQSYLALVLMAQAMECEALQRTAEAASLMRDATSIDPQIVRERGTYLKAVAEAARDTELERYAFETLSHWDSNRPAPRALGFAEPTAAVRFYKAALHSRPGDARLTADLGQALHATGDYQAAEKAFAEAHRKAPDAAWTQYDLGMLKWRLERTNEAHQALMEAARLAPRNAAILGTLGLLLLRSGQAAEAERALLAAMNARPDVWVLARVYGGILLGQNKVPQAVRAFREAERLGANDADFRLDYADALMQLDQTQAAEEQFRLALRAGSHQGNAHARYGAYLFAQCRLADAEEQLQQALLWEDGEPAHTTLAGLYLLERRLDEAALQLQSALQHDPRATLVQQYQAEWLLLRGQAAEAQMVAQRLRDQGVSRGSLLLVLGGALLALDRKLEAQAALREAARVDPSLPATILKQTRALRALGHVESALESVAQALAIAPNWPEALSEQQSLLAEKDQAVAGSRSQRKAPQRPRS